MLLFGRAWPCWKLPNTHFFPMGQERSLLYGNTYKKIERGTEVVPGKCCCSAFYDLSLLWVTEQQLCVTSSSRSCCHIAPHRRWNCPVSSHPEQRATESKPHSFANPDLSITTVATTLSHDPCSAHSSYFCSFYICEE